MTFVVRSIGSLVLGILLIQLSYHDGLIVDGASLKKSSSLQGGWKLTLENGSHDCVVVMRLENWFEHGKRIVLWDSPFEDELKNSVFQSVGGGSEFVYTGRIAEYRDQHIPLDDGHAVHQIDGNGGYAEREIDLCEYYRFPAPTAPMYQVTASFLLLVVPDDAERSISQRECEEHNIKASSTVVVVVPPIVGERGVVEKNTPRGILRSYAKKFWYQSYACSESQAKDIGAAIQNAYQGAQSALEELPGGLFYMLYTSDLFYWLGKWSEGVETTDEALKIQITTMMAHLAPVDKDDFNFLVTYDCSCRERYYAYVYPDKNFGKRVFLCNAFWNAPADMNHPDSRPGVLVHELSHFTSIAGTLDLSYRNHHDLVEQNVGKARINADNVERFVETDHGELLPNYISGEGSCIFRRGEDPPSETICGGRRKCDLNTCARECKTDPSCVAIEYNSKAKSCVKFMGSSVTGSTGQSRTMTCIGFPQVVPPTPIPTLAPTSRPTKAAATPRPTKQRSTRRPAPSPTPGPTDTSNDDDDESSPTPSPTDSNAANPSDLCWKDVGLGPCNVLNKKNKQQRPRTVCSSSRRDPCTLEACQAACSRQKRCVALEHLTSSTGSIIGGGTCKIYIASNFQQPITSDNNSNHNVICQIPSGKC